jgi:catechol 2,3-dioxygenase-like lactoylglutathione lyase family enzyme
MKLSHVAIGCADIEKVATFYVEMVGLTEAFRLMDDEGALRIIYLDAGGDTFLELLNRGGEVQAAAATGLSHICLEVDDIKATIAGLQQSGVEITTPVKVASDGNLQAWITDPEGGRIEFMQLADEGAQRRYLESK